MKKLIALAFALPVLAGCASSHMTTARLPDGTTVATVYSSGQDLTIAGASISKYECRPGLSRKDGENGQCVHIASGGGITSGGAGIVGPIAQSIGMYAAARVAPSSDIAVTSLSGASSRSKSIGPGSSSIKFDATVKGTNTNTNAATAGAAAIQAQH